MLMLSKRIIDVLNRILGESWTKSDRTVGSLRIDPYTLASVKLLIKYTVVDFTDSFVLPNKCRKMGKSAPKKKTTSPVKKATTTIKKVPILPCLAKLRKAGIQDIARQQVVSMTGYTKDSLRVTQAPQAGPCGLGSTPSPCDWLKRAGNLSVMSNSTLPMLPWRCCHDEPRCTRAPQRNL